MNLTALYLFITRTVAINSNWTKSLTKIRDEYFDPHLTAVFTDGGINNIMDQILKTMGPVIVYDVNQPPPEAQQKFTKSRNVLIVYGSPYSDLKFHRYFFFHAQSRILVMTMDSPKKWLEKLWRATRAVNAVILAMDTLKLYTWFPYKSGECSTVREITELSEDFYSKKIGTNFNNCNLRVVSTPIYLFVFNETDGNFQQGVDTNIMITFASKYNLNRTLVKADSEVFWAGIVPGHGPKGALQFVHEGIADFAIGTIMLHRDYLQYADATVPYFEDSLSWFVPIPNFIPNVEKIPKTVSGTYGVHLSITLAVITTVSAIAAYFTGTSVIDTIFNSIRAYVVSSVMMPKHPTMKLLIIFTFFFSMHITIGFQSALFYLLANDVSEEPITDIHQALDRNLIFHLYYSHRHLFNQSGTGSFLTNAIMEKKLYKFSVTHPVFSTFIHNKTGVLLGPKRPYMFLFEHRADKDEYGRTLMTPLREPFMSKPVVILTEKGHPLLPLIEITCQQLREAGIISWWLTRISNIKTVTVIKENIPLSIDALIGAFIILCIFLFISLMSFFAEILVHILFK